MSLEALAALRISLDTAKAALPPDVSPTPLDDGVVVPLGVKLTEAEPELLAARLRELLGDALDAHDHPRGVPVYPASYSPKATTFDALVEELGEAADWIALEDEPDAGDPMAAMAGLLGDAGVDIAALQQQMASGDPNALMDSAMQLAQQLADSGKLGEVQQAMAGMMGGMDPREMLAQSGIDVAALEQKVANMDPATLQQLGVSRESVERALAETGGDPRAALEKLGLPAPSEDDDDPER